MKRSSWLILTLCIVLAGALVFLYCLSQMGNAPLTEAQAREMIQKMQTAVEHKDVNTIMNYISPDQDIKIANLKRDQLRVLLARTFHSAMEVRADVNNFGFEGGATEDATAQFDLALNHEEPGLHAEVYAGHITLHLHRTDIPHLFGLYSTHEWRVIGGETTGPDPSNFGDF